MPAYPTDRTNSVLRIPPVVKGAKVAIVSPASYPQPEKIALGADALRAMGWEPFVYAHVLSKANGYFAGSAADRLEDLHAAFREREVSAIFCSRGGYGSNYLLPRLDLGLIRENPKPLIGYSDLTCLQTWLLDQIGLPAFYGPMVAADFSLGQGVDTTSLLAALEGEAWKLGPEAGLRILRPGRAEGILYGGCLTLLAASLGTPFSPKTEGKLLFLEDLAVKPYQLDRLLRQMQLAGKFEGVTGLIFGEMVDCLPPGQDMKVIEDMILRIFDAFDGPIAIGLRSGHVSTCNTTLVFGIPAALRLENQPELCFRAPAVRP